MIEKVIEIRHEEGIVIGLADARKLERTLYRHFYPLDGDPSFDLEGQTTVDYEDFRNVPVHMVPQKSHVLGSHFGTKNPGRYEVHLENRTDGVNYVAGRICIGEDYCPVLKRFDQVEQMIMDSLAR